MDLSGDSREMGSLTVGIGHSQLSLFEILHLVDDFVGYGFQFAHLGFQSTQALLICDRIVVDSIGTNVDVQIDGDHRNLIAALGR